MDSKLKEQAENVLEQFGLNMTVVVNMLFKEIVREQAIPLSLALYPKTKTIEDLNHSKAARSAGYAGRSADVVISDMERIVAEAEVTYGKKKL